MNIGRQQGRELFFEALRRYEVALLLDKAHSESKREFVLASVAVHQALAYVPKRYKTFVNRAFKQAATVKGTP